MRSLILIAAALLSVGAFAQDRELTRSDLEPWLDGFLPLAMQQSAIAGGVVVVAKDGAVLLEKGYGFADAERRTPVNPERTLFRLASVSKLFTWTAVMQLVEQGKLDLDRDINDYLDFEVPRAFDAAITMRHLMTHTPGFDERLKAVLRSEGETREPLASYVKSALPERIFLPGKVPAYSNYGVALAGYIVERVSGEAFEEYIERHILQPLGMLRSTFRQPVPTPLAAELSKGYLTSSAPPWYFEQCVPVPAGALSATGSDMARFMLAHLQAEQGAGSPLFSAATARRMHRSGSHPIAGLDGLSLGFEATSEGRSVIGHSGSTQVFRSDLRLFIDDGVGVLTIFNSAGNDGSSWEIIGALHERFARRYFPEPVPTESGTTTALEHAQLLVSAGPYQSSRRAESGFLTLAGLLGQQEARVNPDATLVLPFVTNMNGQPKVWREVSPFVWREVGGSHRLAAQVEEGKVTAVGLDSWGGTEVLQPVPRSRSARWNVPLLTGACGVLLVSAIGWPVLAIARRRLRMQARDGRVASLAVRGSRVAVIANLMSLAGWFIVIRAGFADLAVFDATLDPWLRALQVLGLVGAVGTAFAICKAVLLWQARASWTARIWSVVVAAANLAVVWIAFRFDLLSLSLVY